MTKRDNSRRCLNCKRPVQHKFCGGCGQRNLPARMPVWTQIGHALGEHVLFESRMARTVLPFLVRPGFLTREYNAGRRVRYSAPVRVYLLMSVVLFLTLGVTRFVSDLALLRELGVTDTEFTSSGAPPMPEVEGFLSEPTQHVQQFVQEVQAYRGRYDRSISETLARWLGDDHAVTRYVASKFEKLESMGWARARLAGFDNWLNLLPTAMFLLLPFCAAVLKACFLGRGRFYVEHFVFVLHQHAYIYFALILLQWYWAPVALVIAAMVIAVYTLLGLQTAYGGWLPGTLVRGVLFLALYIALLLAGLAATFAVSLMMI